MAPKNLNMISTINKSPTLLQKLASVLPKDVNFRIYHLSTPPSRTSALYPALPGARPDRTYCECHFLAVSIQTENGLVDSEPQEVLVYAIEVLIYSTAHDTTLFVSKADSTGYLHRLNLPKGSPSPLRDISTTFLQHLVRQRQRHGIQTIVSLFARAQDQYLFPGSVEYHGKHVLDDRGLIRWWCRVLTPIISDPGYLESDASKSRSITGYLVVPGLDPHETQSYVPKSAKSSWEVGHPLYKISPHSGDVPPRCLIPHFPDDPKARFLDELDDEIVKGQNSGSGHWKSVKTVEQFWDMMAFRQECSAGRLVGFIWIVLEPLSVPSSDKNILIDSQNSVLTFNHPLRDNDSPLLDSSIYRYHTSQATNINASSHLQPASSPTKNGSGDSSSSFQLHCSSTKRSTIGKKKKQEILSGLIIPRAPRIKTETKNYLLDKSERSPYYSWSAEARGQVIVSEVDYKRLNELLLRLDFANLKLATSSSKRWINEVRSGACGDMRDSWGRLITGTKFAEDPRSTVAAGVSMLNVGLVRKRKKEGAGEADIARPSADNIHPIVNVLASGMIRKKAKA